MLSELAIALLLVSFRVLHASWIPNGAEVVFPQLYESRDQLGAKVLKVNDKLTLNLKKGSIAHDEFFIQTYRQGVPLRTYVDVDALEEGLFEDERHFASVFVTEDSGSVKVEGVVGPNLKIRPLENMERANNGPIPHVVDLIDKQQPDDKSVYGEPLAERNLTAEERSWKKDPYSVRRVYPEVRLVVDSVFRRGFNNTRDLVRYILIEWNCVRLRYLTVNRPEIRLKLRAIELTPYYKEREYYKYLIDDREIDALESLYSLVKYVEMRNNSYGRYDIVYFTTGMDMVAVQGWQRLNEIQGYAFVGSVCTKMRVGLGEDVAFTYIGVRIMAHELGHTLGCSHDGTEIAGQFPGFHANSVQCPWEAGYLMSYYETDSRSMKFSWCCDYSMSLVAWSTNIECLHEITTGSRLKKNRTRTLPGYFLSKNRQCRMTYPKLSYTYFMKNRPLRGCMGDCFVPGRDYGNAADHHWSVLLIDGTRCGQRWERKVKLRS
ncbi:venom metalloproteinase antarease-like TtrivMP_A [Haemaphysalis longicornis]